MPLKALFLVRIELGEGRKMTRLIPITMLLQKGLVKQNLLP